MIEAGEHFRIEPLADGVWAAIATPGRFALCNAAIVDLGGTTLVYDAMLTPQAGAALGRAAERLTGRRADLLVISHYHGDHVRGSGAVGAAHVLSTGKVRDLIVERGPVHLRADRAEAPQDLERLRRGELGSGALERSVYEGWFEGILATPAELEFVPPDLTFATELTIHGRRRSARVLTLGGGHSPSDVILVLPETRIGAFGDLLSVGCHPSMADGEPVEFARILDDARGLGVERAVPGHGPVAGAPGLDQMGGYVRGILDDARRARAEGTPREELAARPPPPPYDRWVFSRFYADNVRFVYDRLAAAETAPGLPTGGR
jgi:cyclase